MEDLLGDIIPYLPHVILVFLTLRYVFDKAFSFRNSHDSASPLRYQDSPDDERCLMSNLALLARLAYCTTKRMLNDQGKDRTVPDDNPHPRIQTQSDGSVLLVIRGDRSASRPSYHVINTFSSNAIWLLRPTDTTCSLPARWIIAFRGTQVLSELVTDARLTLSVASGQDTGLGAILDKQYEKIRTDIIERFGIKKTDSIALVGHSLGATIAEAMLLRLKDDDYKAVSAYGFETPGLPDWYRDPYLPICRSPPDLTFVYGHDNIINTLTSAPDGSRCFLVGRGDPFLLSNVRRFFHEIFGNCPKAVYKVMVGSLKSHEIDSLITLLEEGYMVNDPTVARRSYTGSVLRLLYDTLPRAITSVGPTNQGLLSIQEIVPDYGHDDALLQEQEPEFSEYSSFPGVADAVYEFRAKHQRPGQFVPTQYAIPDIQAFAKMMNPREDIVVPFVGLTSVGKSSLLKALFNVSPDNEDVLRVNSGKNTTKTRSIMLWKMKNEPQEDSDDAGQPFSIQNHVVSRIWLMDIPGVYGTSGTEVPVEYATISSQLASLKFVVQAGCYVTDGVARAEAKLLFREIARVLKDRVFVVHNCKSLVLQDKEKTELLEDSVRDYSEELARIKGYEGKKVEVVLAKVARCKGATEEHLSSEFGIENLKQKLESWVELKKDEIAEAVREEQEKWQTEYLAGSIAGGVLGSVALVPAALELYLTGSLLVAGCATLAPLTLAAGSTFAIFKGVQYFERRKREAEKKMQ